MISVYYYALIALSILIFVHELGHYLVARLANVKVLVFSLGFGKKLFHFTKRGYRVCPLRGTPWRLCKTPWRITR